MKRYTAKEINDAILKLKAFQEDKVTLLRIEDMLRQAADDMEREEKHEKKYEYAARYSDGHIPAFHCRSAEDVLDGECPFTDEEFVVVRREVGEWEEAKG